jgi:hypothetical protein
MDLSTLTLRLLHVWQPLDLPGMPTMVADPDLLGFSVASHIDSQRQRPSLFSIPIEEIQHAVIIHAESNSHENEILT